MWQLAQKHAATMAFLPNIIHYLDTHSGSFQAIASIILVLVTAVYTVLTRSIAKAATEALRPYVYLDLAFHSIAQMVIVVDNSGTRVASNVKIDLISSNNEKLADLIRQLPISTGIGHLSPHSPRKYEVRINSAELLPKDGPAATLDFHVTYHDGARSISDKQSFNLDGYRSALVFGSNEDLARIVTELRNISNKMPPRQLSIDISVRKSCPYCGTLIAQSATKCHACLEWLSKPTNKRFPRISVTQIRRGHKQQKLRHESGQGKSDPTRSSRGRPV
jgi:hypothetical protein